MFESVWSFQTADRENAAGLDAAAYTSLKSVADVQVAQASAEKLIEAERNYNVALDGLEGEVGWSDQRTSITAHALAQLYSSGEQLELASQVIRRMAGGLAVEFGESDERTLHSESALVDILVQTQEYEEAALILDKIIKVTDPRLPIARSAFQRKQEVLAML